MKQLFPPLTLFSTGTEVTVTGYIQAYPNKADFELLSKYLQAIDSWPTTKITVKVQEENQADLLKLVAKKKGWRDTTGIDISSLADRLEYYEEKRCANACDWPKCTFKDCMEKHPEKWAEGKEWFVRLLPAEQSQTAICPTCGIERKVSVDKEGSGCFVAAEQTETVKEEDSQESESPVNYLYWKQRCEYAEILLDPTYSEKTKSETYSKWNQLRHSKHE